MVGTKSVATQTDSTTSLVRYMSGCRIVFASHATVKSIESYLDTSERVKSKCVLCQGDLTHEHVLPCNHTYCVNCVYKHCTIATIPVKCAKSDCKYKLKSKDLRMAFSARPLEELLKRSFIQRIGALPDQFRFCPLPSCDIVHTIHGDGHEVNCSGCHRSLCAACIRYFHPGQTCQEALERPKTSIDRLAAYVPLEPIRLSKK